MRVLNSLHRKLMFTILLRCLGNTTEDCEETPPYLCNPPPHLESTVISCLCSLVAMGVKVEELFVCLFCYFVCSNSKWKSDIKELKKSE